MVYMAWAKFACYKTGHLKRAALGRFAYVNYLQYVSNHGNTVQG
jgi:hypothetical protein